MEANWEMAINFTLDHEGFISDNPNDPGGLTIYGIPIRYHPKEVSLMKVLIGEGKKDEALEIAKKIYREKYWEPQLCPQLPWPYDIMVFDCSVNPGPTWASNALGILKREPNHGWAGYLRLRLRYYAARKPEWRKNFLTGVMNRTLDLWELIDRIP